MEKQVVIVVSVGEYSSNRILGVISPKFYRPLLQSRSNQRGGNNSSFIR